MVRLYSGRAGANDDSGNIISHIYELIGRSFPRRLSAAAVLHIGRIVRLVRPSVRLSVSLNQC